MKSILFINTPNFVDPITAIMAMGEDLFPALDSGQVTIGPPALNPGELLAIDTETGCYVIGIEIPDPIVTIFTLEFMQ